MTTQEVAVVGETQRFECQVIGFPTPTITWYKDEVDITHNPRYNISFDEDLGIITLMIRNVSLADEGCYVCRAENSEGFATTTAYLVVRVERGYDAQRDFSAMTVEKVTEEERSQVEVIKVGRSTVIEEVVTHIEETEKEVFEEKTVAPKITYEARLKDQLSFKEGATVYLEVNFTGYPLPQVTWYHNDREIAESASVTMETMDGWSYLKVKGTTSQNAGIYRVVAENVAGKDSAEFRIVIKSPPSSPRNLRVVEVYKDYIIIAWDEPEHAGGDVILGYQVEKSLSGDKFVTAGYADAETTRFKVTKLFEGTDYIFRVSAENRVGFGRPATLDKPVKARLPFDPPSCPQNLRVKETNKDYITVAWDKPENNGGSDIIQYIIEKRDATRGGSMWIVAGTVDADEYSFRCTKLFQGNKYLFRVSAENRVGSGEAAELKEPVIAKLPYDKPMPPRNLHALETNRDYIVIAWEAPESDGGAPITNYVLEKHDAKHPGYIYMADVDANTFQYKATRLFEGYEYYFQVIAENQVGPSDPCETKKPIKAKLPFDEPDKPTNVRVKEYWTDYITVTWDAPANDGGSPITGYIIEKRDVSRQNWVKAGAVGSDVTTFKVGNLFEGAQYLIRVFAENKVGPSKEAAELDMPCKAKMPFDPPFAPRNLKVIDYNTDYITISWQPPENDGGSPIKGYVIEKHDIHMPMWMQAATVDKDTFSYKVENLFEGQSYEFRVAAENECGRGHYIQTERPTQARLPYNKPSAPRALRVTDVWKDYISLLWEEPESDGGSPLMGYTIEQRDAYEATYRFVVALGADVTTYQVTNLQEGHEYYFRMYSQNAAGLSERPAELKPPVKARLPFDKPSCPRSIRCTGTGPGAISIAWDTPESDGGAPITHYHVETCRTSQVNYSRVATLDATTTEFDITGLVDGADYYIRVYAENKAGESKRPCELDEPVKAMKPIYKPGPPVNLRVLDTNKDHITIAWDAPENDGGSEITNYLIESCSELDINYIPIAKVDGRITKYTARGLLEGSDYKFRVKARNAAGVSDEGVQLNKPVTAKLPFDPPAAPNNLRVTGVDKYEISLAWDAPEFDGGSKLTGYIMEMKSSLDKKYRCLRTLAETATSYTAVGLTEGTEYYFRIRAKNDAGIGEPNELREPVTARAPYDIPKEPKNLQVTDTDSNSVTISWQPPESDGGSPIVSYVIEMRSAKETKYKVIGKVSADTLSYTATDLKEGSKYTFRVKSENVAGMSDACKLDKPVKVEAKLVAPNSPTNLRVSEANKDCVKLTWSAPETNKTNPVGSYVIEMKALGEVDFVPVAKVDGRKTTHTVKNLIAGEKYEFRVRAKNEAGLSSEGAELVEPLLIQTVKEQKKAKEEAKLVTSSESEEKETKKVKKVKEESDKVEPKEEKPQKAESKRKESKKAEQKEEKTEEIEHKEEKPKKEKPEKKESEKEESKVEKLEEVEAVQEKPKKAEPKKKKEEKVEEKSEKKPEEIEPKEEKPKKVEEPAESVSLPSAPVDLMVESVSSESLTVKWSPSPSDGGSAILHYIIVMREAAKKKFKKVGKVAGNILSYSITSNLEPAKEYFIRVYAENSVGISESAAETKSAVKIPAKVTEVKEEEVKEEEEEEEEEIVEEEVEIVETKATEAEAPQQQEEAELKNEAKEALEEASEEQTISDTREKPAAAEKPQTVPSAPLNLIIKDLSSTSVTLSWEAPANDGNTEITSYLVVMREAEKNKFKKVGQTNGSTLSLTVTKVKEGREYYFRVYAENKVGISEDMAELEQSVKIPVKEPLAEQMAAKVEETEQKPAEDQLDSAPVSRAPVITIEPEPVTVMEGETIRLTCQVTGQPKPEVSWFKGSKQFEKSDGHVKLDFDSSDDVHLLIINKATPEDAGQYTVVASNDGGTVSATVNVAISVPEEVKVTEEEVTVTTEQTTKEEKTEEKKVEKQKEKKPKEKKPTKEEPKEEKPKEEKPEEDKQKQEEAEKEKSQEAVEETLEKVEESPKEKKPKEKKKKKEVVEEKVTKEEEEKVEEKPKEEKKKKKEKKEEPKEEEKPKEKKEKKKKEKEAKVEEKPEEQEREKEAEMPKEEDKVKEEEKSQQKEKAEEKPKEEETEKQEEPAKGEEKPRKEVKEKKEKDKPKGPKFTKQPQPVCVTEGETFKLTCQIEEEAEVTWFKDTNKIKPKKKGDKKYKVDWDMDSDVYYLQVADATADDAGEYKVSAKSAKGTSIVKVTVTVEKKKVAPQIKGRLLPINIEVGEGFKLSCKVIGFPEPKVTWLKNKETISEKDGHYEITVKENTYTLKVKESVSEDTAEYTVTATNAVGSTSQSTEVTIKPKAEPVEEQTEKVEEVPVMEKSKLKPPEFVAHPDDIKVTECTELRILVTVKGSSEISVMWFMNGKPVKPNEHIKVSQDGDNYILSIPKCSLSDAGEYTCTAKDLGGESFCSVNVTVEESAEKRAEEEAHRELMEQLSPKIREEQTKIKESDMDMLLKEFAMLGPYTDSDKKVHLSKGDVVEVLDTEKKAEWLVRKQSEKEKVCYVPVELLLGKKPEEEEVIEEEESSAEDEETTETAKAYTTYTAITDYNPSAENKDHLSLKEGELVVVMDSSSTDRWWCRRSSTPTDEGWVPPGYLVTQTEEKLDTRTTQEVFREDVIKVSNKEQEAVLKRRYALKDLWESERLYIDDLKYCLDTYYKMLEGDNVPDELKNKHDTIFSTLPDIKNFHCNKFLDELLMTTNDADSIAGAFLKHCDLFQLYVPYFKERNITAYLLGLEGPVKFLKLAETAEENNLNKKSGNVGEKRMTLLDFLHRPWTRIDEYVSLLKDFIKYTAHANQDYSKLEEAVQMLLELKKQADDQQTLARIEGYPGNIAELGPILRHDDFTVWDGEPVGKGRERHLFLFKENLMLTKKKKAEKAGSPPTYEFKGLIDLPKTLLNEELDDNKRFELCFEDLRRGKFTFQAKSVPVKITWCDLLRRWLRKWGKKPTVSKKLEQSTVREGDPAVFSCHIEGQPLPEVTWYYNDSPIKDDTDFRIIADLFDFSLTIPHTTPENSGKYSLKAKNKFGEEELSAELFVKEIIIKPEFTSEMKNAEVLLGADARFDCKIKGKPAPDVKWYKGATEVKAGDHYKFLYPDDESYTLLIYKVEEIDLGSYECCAKNKGGKASQSAELIITDLEERKKECPPEFVSGLSDIVAVEGIQTKLVCRVIGYPSPEVTWYFNDKPIRRSDYYDYYFSGTECTLIIRIVHEEHMGKYTCKIKNKFGEQQTSADLKVATRPKFTHRFSNLEVFRNEKAQFVAKYQGFPKPDVTWYFEKLPMADSERVKITQTETKSVLTIDLVMAMDEGEYNCKLTNQAGEASCSAVLFVLKDIQSKDYEVSYAPTLVKKLASQEAIIGAPAKFSVKALGEPLPTAKWYKNGKEITETDRIHLVQEDNVYRLVFKKVEASDDGEYKCVISNKSGEVSTVAQLLTEEPKEPIKVEEEMKIELRELPPTLVVHKPDLVEVDFETIKLSWQKALLPKNAKPTAIKYAIDRKDISTLSGDWETIETGIEGLSMEIKNFNPEIDYLFRIRATNEYGSSDPSMAVSYYGKTKSDIKKKRRDSIEAKQPVVDIKKEPLPPRGPREKPQIQEVADDCLEISWQPGELPPHAIQTEILYIVERRNPPSKSWIEIASDVKETKFIMKNYKPEKDYMFRVRASNDYGISDPSMSATHFAKPALPELDIKAKKKDEDAYKSKVKPRTIWDKPEISNLTEKTLSLKWKASGVPSYAVQTPIWYIVEQRQPPNVDWVKIATDVKEPELHNIRINRSKDYYWRVKAANEFGISEPSMPVMLKKKEEIEEPKEDTTRQRRRSRSYSREPADRGVPEHMRIPPEFIATPDENQYGVEGRTMKVIANIRAYPKPEVSWYMYGRKLQMGDRLTSSLTDKGELSLEIQQFCWSDVGEYKVEVRNEYGMAAQMIKVDMADPPTFLEPLHDQIFHLRGNSKLECRVHGIPYPTVTFKKDWRVIADSQRIKIVREEYDHWTLNIRNAIHLDEGLYECVAENVAGKVYCSANVKVTEKHGLWRDIKFNPCPVEDFFHVIDEIGRGSYGVVRRVIDKNSGNQYAAKILRYGDLIIKEELMTELEILAQLDHQNIVQVIDGYEDKKRLIIIMEIVTGGELLQRLIKEDTLTESEVAFYIRQLLLAVEYMHSKNVIHLDLKPENLYLSSPSSENLKVIDFSFARKYNPTRRLHVKYGTPQFVSPEVLCEEPVTPAADLWSVGVITYTLLSGLSPFHRDTIRDTLLAVRAGGWKFDEEAFSNISAETKDFISQLLVLDPKKRLTATEALDHPFINFAHRRGLGDRINLDRHKAYMFRRKWERGTNLVMTLVKPVPLSSYLIEQPPPEFEFEMVTEIPMLQLPDGDQPTTSGPTEGLQVELGAAGMLSLMGPPSMVSAAPSTVGSGGSSEWGREYEDEDTWYEFSSVYQTGVDTHLLPSKDTRMGVRMAGYRRTLGKPDQEQFPAMQSAFQPARYRGSMKERQDLRDLEKEREESEDVAADHLRHTRRGLWQVRRMIELDKASEGFPPIFKEKIKDKAYNVGDSCTLRVHVIGNPPPILSWYRNDELLSTGGRVRILSSEEGIHSLTVLQTKPNDFGVYKCVARNKYGTVTCRARMLCGDHPSRPGRPHVTKVSDTEAFMIWEEPESDGNSHIQAYKVDWLKPGEQRWTTATYCIDECALVKGLKPDTSYRFRVSAINAFGTSPYSWASVEVRTKKKGADPIEIEEETKRILLRSRQATNRPSPESSPLSSPHGSMTDLTEEDLERKAKDHGVLDREIMLQEIEPERFLAFGSDVWRGRYTLVKNVKPKQGRKVRRVAKILCYDESNAEDSLREYEMLKGIRQQHIVRLYEAYLHNNFVYLIFEKLYGENVARSLSLKNKYNEHHVTSIIKQVLDGLQFLHHIGIVHLNLQPDNVIMVSRRRFDIKLIDFGRARKITSFDGVKVPREGTAEFMAPEKVAGELVGVAADIWGVGLLAFILLSGVSPFEGDLDEDTFANILHVRYDAHTLYHNVTKYALKFIYQTLKRNPKARLTTEEALDHRWLMLNAPMVKVRKAAVFPTDKLRLFEENYIKRRLAGRSPPERLMNAYGIGLSFSSDEEGDDWLTAGSKY